MTERNDMRWMFVGYLMLVAIVLSAIATGLAMFWWGGGIK